MATMQPLPQLQPMEQPDLLERFGKVMYLKNLMQQQQLQQQQMGYLQQMQPLQVQHEQLQIQQEQRAMDSQKALLRALTENPTADPDELAQTAMGYGAYPGDILPTVNQLKESAQHTATLRGTNLDNAKKVTDYYGDQSQMLLGIKDPAQKQQTY